MPTLTNATETTACFFFNHVISLFEVPLWLEFDHEKNFENEFFIELSHKLGFTHNFASPYYPQSNGKVKAIYKFLKTLLQ